MRRNAGDDAGTFRTGGVLLGFALVLIALALGSQVAFAAWGDPAADRVVGQFTFHDNKPNQGFAAPTDRTLKYPVGVSVDRASGRLYVSDRKNARVQSWPQATSFSDGAAADKSWAGTGPFAIDPVATATDASGNLYVADLVDNRVFVYPPYTTTVAHVIGQVNFTSFLDNQGLGDPTPSTLSGPYSVATDASGHLFVADQTNNRVLRYTLPITGNNKAADLVLGQADLISGQPNRGGTTSRNSLYNPKGVAVDGNGSVYVSDTGNNRILKFAAPLSTGMNASLVLGQPDYVSNSPNQGHGSSNPSAQTLDNPVGIAVDNYGRIYVADTNNHRVIGYSPAGIVNGAAARFIVGQPNFGAVEYDPSAPPTASALAYPFGVAVDGAANLYVADTYNNRALGYDLPWAWEVDLPLIIK